MTSGRLLSQPLQQVVAHTDRIGDRGKRWIDRADADEKARVDDVQVVQLVCLAVYVQYRGLWVAAEAAGARLMRAARYRNVDLHVDVARDETVRVHAEMAQHRLELVIKPLLRDLVVRRVAQRHIAGLVDGDAIFRIGQVLGGEPEIHRVTGKLAEQTERHQRGFKR